MRSLSARGSSLAPARRRSARMRGNYGSIHARRSGLVQRLPHARTPLAGLTITCASPVCTTRFSTHHVIARHLQASCGGGFEVQRIIPGAIDNILDSLIWNWLDRPRDDERLAMPPRMEHGTPGAVFGVRIASAQRRCGSACKRSPQANLVLPGTIEGDADRWNSLISRRLSRLDNIRSHGSFGSAGDDLSGSGFPEPGQPCAAASISSLMICPSFSWRVGRSKPPQSRFVWLRRRARWKDARDLRRFSANIAAET